MKEIIYNFTQHVASAEQTVAGIIDLPVELREELKVLLTFNTLPTSEEVNNRAIKIVDMVDSLDASAVMIGGAPYLMSALERALYSRGVRALYAFSARESVEEVKNDGSVVKITVFKHVGFVEF